MEEKEKSGIRSKEWNGGRLSNKQESDHEPLYKPCLRVSGNPSEGNEENESDGSEQENSLKGY